MSRKRYRIRLYAGKDEVVAQGYVAGGAELVAVAEWPDAKSPFCYSYQSAPWRYWKKPFRRVGELVFERLLHWPAAYYVYDKEKDEQTSIRANRAEVYDGDKKVAEYPFGEFHTSAYGMYRVILPLEDLP